MGRHLVPSRTSTPSPSQATILTAGTDAPRRTLLHVANGSCIIESRKPWKRRLVQGRGAVPARRQRRLRGERDEAPRAVRAVGRLLPVPGTHRRRDRPPASRCCSSTPIPTASREPIPNIGGCALYAVRFADVSTPARPSSATWIAGGVAVGRDHEGRGLRRPPRSSAPRASWRWPNQAAKDREQFEPDQSLPGRPVPGERHPHRHAPRRPAREVGGMHRRRQDDLAGASRHRGRIREEGVPTCSQAHEAPGRRVHRRARPHAPRRSKFWENNLGDARYHRSSSRGAMQLDFGQGA